MSSGSENDVGGRAQVSTVKICVNGCCSKLVALWSRLWRWFDCSPSRKAYTPTDRFYGVPRMPVRCIHPERDAMSRRLETQQWWTHTPDNGGLGIESVAPIFSLVFIIVICTTSNSTVYVQFPGLCFFFFFFRPVFFYCTNTRSVPLVGLLSAPTHCCTQTTGRINLPFVFETACKSGIVDTPRMFSRSLYWTPLRLPLFL